ncbi:MAG: hypothetical protein IKN57_13610, partial [Parasporobacterium sp.]|nr:hypothetical protein [Parasporobacterium sp.]
RLICNMKIKSWKYRIYSTFLASMVLICISGCGSIFQEKYSVMNIDDANPAPALTQVPEAPAPVQTVQSRHSTELPEEPAKDPLSRNDPGLLTSAEPAAVQDTTLDNSVPGNSGIINTAENSSQEQTTISVKTEDIHPLYEEYSLFIPELSEEEYGIFLTIYQGIYTFQDKISLPRESDEKEIQKIMALMSNDCPELMMLGNHWNQTSNYQGGIISVSPSYILTQKEWEDQYAAVSGVIENFHNQLSADVPDFDAELAIYDHIIANCVYTTETSNAQTPYGALVEGLAKCDGRAKAFVWALRSFNIPSSVITGSDHAWAILLLDGYYYNADPTYDDNETIGAQEPCSYAHFNVPESSIYDNPYPADDIFREMGYPATVRWDANYHVKNNLWVYSGQDARAMFDKQLGEALANENKTGLINMRFETPEDYMAAVSQMSDWIQDYLDNNNQRCSMVSYDLASKNIIFFSISFQ